MDLQTMKNVCLSFMVNTNYFHLLTYCMQYLKTHYYSSREQFLEHFNLIVTNCITYNGLCIMWSCYHVNPHWHIGFEHELTQNAQRLLEVCTQEIKKVHITLFFIKNTCQIFLVHSVRKSLQWLNNRSIPLWTIMLMLVIIFMMMSLHVCVYLGCNVLSAGDGSEQNEECS